MKHLKKFNSQSEYTENKKSISRPYVAYDGASVHFKGSSPKPNEIWYTMYLNDILSINNFSDLYNFTNNEYEYSLNIKNNITISEDTIKYNFNIDTITKSCVSDKMTIVDGGYSTDYSKKSEESIFLGETYIESLIFPRNFEIPSNTSKYILAGLPKITYIEYKGESLTILEEPETAEYYLQNVPYIATLKNYYVTINNTKYYLYLEFISSKKKIPEIIWED